MSPLRKAIDAVGGVAAAAKICAVSPRAVYKWLNTGSLPRTEYTGETEYAHRLSEAAASRGVDFTPGWLLAAAAPGATSAGVAAGTAKELPAAKTFAKTAEGDRCATTQSATPGCERREGDPSVTEHRSPTPDGRRGRRTADPSDAEIEALRAAGEQAVALADRLAG